MSDWETTLEKEALLPKQVHSRKRDMDTWPFVVVDAAADHHLETAVPLYTGEHWAVLDTCIDQGNRMMANAETVALAFQREKAYCWSKEMLVENCQQYSLRLTWQQHWLLEA